MKKHVVERKGDDYIATQKEIISQHKRKLYYLS